MQHIHRGVDGGVDHPNALRASSPLHDTDIPASCRGQIGSYPLTSKPGSQPPLLFELEAEALPIGA